MMAQAAARGRLALQRCAACGRVQYPPRELCGACLEDRLDWDEHESAPGTVLAETTLHHTNDPVFAPRLPLRIGLVQLAPGAVAVCFLDRCAPGEAARVTAALDAQGRPVLTARGAMP